MTDLSTRQESLRLWPGVVIVVLQWLSWMVVPIVLPDSAAVRVFAGFAGLAGTLLIVVWWAFFSRAPWWERLGAIALMIVALVATPRFLDESIATGNMGFQFFAYVAPALSLAFVAWAVASRRLRTGPRWAAMVVAILIACGVWTLLRSENMTGYGAPDFKWRWAETAEQRLLARAGDEPTALAPAPAPAAAQTETDWPGFRGPDRNGTVPGVRIETDWSASPPVELWRRPVGPAVSSFAVRGDLLYTQEQRGDDEIVASYRVTTGEPVWRHSDPVRFWDSHIGAGPRATPALGDGRVYTLGATGILNALDAGSGAVVWSRNASSDMSATVPTFAL
ncbi:MAG: PQQ-binding-like beta-propeller repeat protein, partial [Chloroflexi bacterium]|nr:PQQ-binding-like beta-propeller repeat protein [Chloroflexota bacterium]